MVANIGLKACPHLATKVAENGEKKYPFLATNVAICCRKRRLFVSVFGDFCCQCGQALTNVSCVRVKILTIITCLPNSTDTDRRNNLPLSARRGGFCFAAVFHHNTSTNRTARCEVQSLTWGCHLLHALDVCRSLDVRVTLRNYCTYSQWRRAHGAPNIFKNWKIIFDQGSILLMFWVEGYLPLQCIRVE